MAETRTKKKRWRDRVDTMLRGRTTDKRKARLYKPESTGTLRIVRPGEIGPRIAFISTYWPEGNAIFTPFSLAAELAEVGFSLVHVVTSARKPDFEGVLQRLEAAGVPLGAATVVWRENVGKDFGGFKDAFHAFREQVEKADRVLIANDSLVGPLFPSNYFQRLRDAGPGLWAPTESFDRSYHLQSSHLLFSGRDTVAAAQEFFDLYRFYHHRDNIVRYGEVGLSTWFLRRHSHLEAFYTAGMLAAHKRSDIVLGRRKEMWLDLNPQHFYFDSLLEAGFPFVKRELLVRNPLALPKVYERVLACMDSKGQHADILFQHFRPT